MPDTIGRVTVPTPEPSGLTFPLISDHGAGMMRDWTVVEHRFGEAATLAVQRFAVGPGTRRFQFVKIAMSYAERRQLVDFYDAVQGSFQSFTYNNPEPETSTTGSETVPYPVIFDVQPISIDHLATMCKTGLTLLEQPDPSDAPFYPIGGYYTRFPTGDFNESLLSQTQQIIPLVKIRVRNSDVPDIYLSDRRCSIGGQLYLPRLLNVGEPGSDVIMSQDIRGTADNVRFQFGNADRAMSRLVKDTGLKYAEVELTLYHVNTANLLYLWKGIIMTFQVDEGPVFSVNCSDGLYPITQLYPKRTLTHTCWKKFNDGINCPFDEFGTIVPEGEGDPTSCDYGFDSPNGCLAHGMSTFFGGHPTFPQSVFIKDNGTGSLWGLGRDRVTSTSIISDSMWGKCLPEIWCNDNGNPGTTFWANAIVVAVRDESDFMDVLGIVGQGPISTYSGMSVQTNPDGYKYIVAPMADGQLPHGFKVDNQFLVTGYHPGEGLREVHGTDPVTKEYDFFSVGQGTPQHYDVPDEVYSNILTGEPFNILPYAAGTAFVELRYSKDPGKGLMPSIADSHTMTVPIAKGLGGWIYNTTGGREWWDGLTNPFWVAANMYFRALGIDKAGEDIQLPYLVLDAIMNPDGESGSAQIADLHVPPVIGDQTALEIQYQFQGMLAEFKPFRDWLTEVLACAQGWYTFEFGKLRLGIREHARALSAFTLGNMIYQSLSLQPAETAFEYLRMDFGNAALQYQQDMAEYQDKDFSEYMNRQGSPLSARQRSLGIAFMSQALRATVTRVREEIGGILRPDQDNPYIEWDNNHNASWKTTVLALETYVGQVVSVTHPDMPSYPGPVAGSPGSDTYVDQPENTWNFRITSWKLHKDWSITITGKSVTDSMYDLTVGPKPGNVLPAPLPVLFFSQPLGQWAPYEVQAPPDDAMFPDEWSFDLAQAYRVTAEGIALAELRCTGKQPVNQFIANCGAPDVKKGKVTLDPVGGLIPAGLTLRVAVCAKDEAGKFSPPSDIVLFQIPENETGDASAAVTLHGIRWPKFDGLKQYVVFVSDVDDLICWQFEGDLIPDNPDIPSYLPTDITLTGPFARSTWSLPNPSTRKLRLKAKRGEHFGIHGAGVSTVEDDQIFSNDLIDLTEGAINYEGRVLSPIGRPIGSTPFTHFLITSHDPATGILGLSPNPNGILLPKDAFVIRNRLTEPNEEPYTSVTDTGYLNASNGYLGLTPAVEQGNWIRVIKGTGRGETRKITDNTADTLYWDRPLQLDETSIWIVEQDPWIWTGETELNNANPLVTTSMAVPVENLLEKPVVVIGVVVDKFGKETSETHAPIREGWVFGSHATREIFSTGDPDIDDNVVMLPTDGLVKFYTDLGPITYTCLPFVTLPNQIFFWHKKTTDTNTVTIKVDPSTDDAFDEEGSTEIVLEDHLFPAMFKVYGRWS